MQILDYSAGYPGALSVKQAGYGGVIRYLRKEGVSSVKPIVKVEYDDMRFHNLDVAFVYQHVRKSRTTEGIVAGGNDAAWAYARIRDLGTTFRAIYFAVDFDAAPNQYASIADYMVGAAAIIGKDRVGVYGKYDLLEYLFKNNVVTWGWQTYAWSKGHNQDPRTYHSRAHLFQKLSQVVVNGIACDVNDVLRADYGQNPNPNPPAVFQVEEEDEMKTMYVHGDAEGFMPAPHETTTWGDAVFIVEATADGLKRRHVSQEEWHAASAAGAVLSKHSQEWIDSIPFGTTAGLFWWEDNEEDGN